VTSPPVPRVSVLMTVLNGERYLDEAIGSVVGQDYAGFEIVVVDDGSTDATSRILERWAARDARVRVFRNEINVGIARATNIGLAATRAPYVARLDADDLCMPGRLGAQVDLLDRHGDVVLVSTWYETIDRRGRRLSTERRTAPPEVIAYLMHFSNAIGGHSQVMFRREAVLEIGGYCHDFDVCVDYELWSRLLRRGRFAVLPIVGMKYRLHADRVSVRQRELQRHNSLLVARRLLTSLFGVELADADLQALASVWCEDARREAAPRAHQLLTRAYALFRTTTANRSDRRLVRVLTARRWTLAAAAFARTGEIREAAIHVAYAWRWHPLGFLAGVATLATRFLTALRLRSERYGAGGDSDIADEPNSVIPLA